MRLTAHPEYSVWQGMKRRCYNPNFKQFHQYGGRGITVCDRWISDFAAFLKDMGPRPTPFHTIDRIDVDKGYSPENCQWATRREQARNRRVTQYVEIFGHKYLAVDIAVTIGVKTETILKRAKRGLSSEQILWPEKIEDRSGLALGGLANGERQRARTHCKHGHPFDAENTSWTPKGTRTCKTCHRLRERRRNAEKRLQAGVG